MPYLLYGIGLERGETPLHLVARDGGRGAEELACQLIIAGADKDTRTSGHTNGITPLICAAHNGNIAIIEKLLQLGADVNKPDREDDSSLWAAIYGHDVVIDKLLASGADVDLPDYVGRTPLLGAATYGHAVVIDKLLAAGADMDKNKDGLTPLGRAAERGDVLIVEKLLAAGAGFDLPDVYTELGP